MHVVWGGRKYNAFAVWLSWIPWACMGCLKRCFKFNFIHGKQNFNSHVVMYNTNIRNIPEKMQKQVELLIQEFKRSIIFKRYARCTNANLNNIIYDKDRICAHWIILCKKLISYRTYQGKDKKVIVKLKETFENMLSETFPPCFSCEKPRVADAKSAIFSVQIPLFYLK